LDSVGLLNECYYKVLGSGRSFPRPLPVSNANQLYIGPLLNVFLYLPDSSCSYGQGCLRNVAQPSVRFLIQPATYLEIVVPPPVIILVGCQVVVDQSDLKEPQTQRQPHGCKEEDTIKIRAPAAKQGLRIPNVL
jgi:hypothetical protein